MIRIFSIKQMGSIGNDEFDASRLELFLYVFNGHVGDDSMDASGVKDVSQCSFAELTGIN